ncbi:MAG: FtsB family cell division protein [Longimicrobiales bacterium]
MRVRYLLGFVLLCGAVYFALLGGDSSLLELRRIRAETEREAERLRDVRRDLERLRARADSLANDDATIERIARERWGLIRPGERLYRFEDAAVPLRK